MVGRLNLHHVSHDDLLDMNFKSERALDSPDSGLPPSPSPSPWLLSASSDRGTGTPVLEGEGTGSASALVKPRKCTPHLHPLSYGEGIELDPLPPKEMRYTSSVRYDSERHFIQDVRMRPAGLWVGRCSQTVVVLPQSTWRHYKTQLELEPRQQAHGYRSTTIVYPKHTRTLYTTQLRYDSRKSARRFLSSLELEASDGQASQ